MEAAVWWLAWVGFAHLAEAALELPNGTAEGVWFALCQEAGVVAALIGIRWRCTANGARYHGLRSTEKLCPVHGSIFWSTDGVHTYEHPTLRDGVLHCQYMMQDRHSRPWVVIDACSKAQLWPELTPTSTVASGRHVLQQVRESATTCTGHPVLRTRVDEALRRGRAAHNQEGNR